MYELVLVRSRSKIGHDKIMYHTETLENLCYTLSPQLKTSTVYIVFYTHYIDIYRRI